MPPTPRRRPAVRRPRVAGRHHVGAPQAASERPTGGTDLHDVDVPVTETPETTAPTEATEAPEATQATGATQAPEATQATETPEATQATGPTQATAGARPTGPAGPSAAAADVADDPAPAESPGHGRTLNGMAILVVLVAVLVIAAGLGAFFLEKSRSITESAGASNEALVDVGTTAQVSGQIRDALETLYSYDHATLDANEAAARRVITGGFVPDFEQQFGEVRELAPAQQAVVTATVPNIAVQYLQDDRAVLLAFIDQRATRSGAEPVATAGRMSVTAERVEGPEGESRWKIADVVPR